MSTEEDLDSLSNPEVTTKYRLAADIANAALAEVMAACAPGKKVVDLCALGDSIIEKRVAELYKKKKNADGKPMEKGVAFPTCISRNNWIASVSPLSDSTETLASGDLIKLDLGVHVGGYCAIGGHSFICPESEGAEPPVATGRAADVIQAAHVAAECVMRLLRPGKTNDDCTRIIGLVADEFNVKPIEELSSYQVKRFVPNGTRQILNRALDPGKPGRLECGTFEFEEGEAYAIDIRLSTGSGKIKRQEDQPTVFKRKIEEKYVLKTKTARQVFSEVNERFPTMAFTLRALSNENAGKFAIRQMLEHKLVEPYYLYVDRHEEALVAVARFTALITSSQTLRITPAPDHPGPRAQSELSVTSNEIKQILQMSVKRNKKNKKKKANAASAAAPAASMDTGGD